LLHRREAYAAPGEGGAAGSLGVGGKRGLPPRWRLAITAL